MRLSVAQRATPGLLTEWSGIDCWDAQNFLDVIDEDWLHLHVLMSRKHWIETVQVVGL